MKQFLDFRVELRYGRAIMHFGRGADGAAEVQLAPERVMQPTNEPDSEALHIQARWADEVCTVYSTVRQCEGTSRSG